MKKLLLAALLALVAFGGLAQVRTGSWVDEVVFFEEPTHAKGIEMVRTGAADVYTFGISTPALVKTIVDTVGYEVSYGSYNELTFNPVGPEYPDGRLNPFAVAKIREAMNWLLDRDFMIKEYYAGVAGIARWFPVTPSFPDYAKLADVAKKLEILYGYDFDKAKAVISEEMTKLGATLVGGKWQYKGKPVILKGLIRTEDERRQIGDYICDQLEKIGFTVERDYKPAAAASPIWLTGDPALGLWDFYTGGWVTTVVDRDQADNWNFFYTKRGRPEPLWQAYKPDPEFDELSERLARNDFRTEQERLDMMARAMELGLKDSARVWLTNRVSYFARNKNIAVASDLAGGVYGAWLWSRTLKWTDRPGGVGGVVMMGNTSMLTEPWNPIAGTNWIFDMMPIRGVSDYATLPDPFTGLAWPQLVEKAEVFVEEGLPSLLTLELGKDFGGGLKGWITQKFMPVGSIVVPADAWADWDPKAGKFITASERFGGPVSAKSKVVVTYAKGLTDRLWHDGSKWSIADGIIGFILTFERGKPESPIYDEAVAAPLRTFMAHFKGLKILQTSPQIVFEVYSDSVFLEAESTASSRAAYLMPQYSQGVAPWHTIALGIQAEAAGKLAFSSAKSRARGVDWTNYISGQSLTILAEYLADNLKTNYIPFASVLSAYVTAADAGARYKNADAFYKKFGHLWIANGPMYVDQVRPVEKVVVLRRFAQFADAATKWDVFAEPKIAKVAVTGPASVKAGAAADLKVAITFKDKPYELVQIDFVKFLLFDGAGNVVATGAGTPVKDGEYTVKLTADMTKGLAGACRVEVIVASKVVGMPSTATFSFVVTK